MNASKNRLSGLIRVSLDQFAEAVGVENTVALTRDYFRYCNKRKLDPNDGLFDFACQAYPDYIRPLGKLELAGWPRCEICCVNPVQIIAGFGGNLQAVCEECIGLSRTDNKRATPRH